MTMPSREPARTGAAALVHESVARASAVERGDQRLALLDHRVERSVRDVLQQFGMLRDEGEAAFDPRIGS